MSDRYELPGGWGIRRQHTVEPQWAIQFMGMDWIKIEDFLAPGKGGVSTLDEEMRKFAEAIGATPVSSSVIG